MAGGVLVDLPRLGQMAENLGDEERVPVGLAVHRVREPDRRVAEAMTRGRFHQCDDTGVVEAGQFDVRDAAQPMQRGQGLDERVRT